MRKPGQTNKQKIKELELEIKRLQEVCFYYMRMVEDFKKSENLVHISELEKRDIRIKTLISKLQQLGAYCGD